MSKVHLFIVVLLALLWAEGSYAQKTYVLTLEQMFALADENSKTIKAEDAAVIEAQQGVKVAKNGYLPDIDISLSASYLGNGYLLDREFKNGQSVPMPHFGNNFAIEATQLIYAGGAVTNGVAVAKLKEEMASANREAARSRIRFMLTGFYLDLYKLRNALKVYDKNIELTRIVIEDTKARNKAGVALQNDVTRYELQLKNLELARRRIENSVEILNYDLVTMLGLPADTQIGLDTTMLAKTLPVEGVAYWQQMAESNAHAIKQSALAVEIGERAEMLARAERRPTVALFAANHFDGPITIEVPTINKNFNYWYIGVGVSFPIHSLYKANKSIRQAQYSTMLSRRRQDEVVEQTSLTIQSDYVRYMEAYDEVATLEKSVQLANENYQVIENRYRNDIVLVTDMLDASTQLLDAELKLVNARINVIFNYYKLKNTSGNL
ncbi:MAG: TolC family protein [Bacteroidaceae bacterium]|nr:TolC family protein [Bacteroidaceae bacterium]